MLREAIMAMMPFEERTHSRFVTPIERELIAGIAERRRIRRAYASVQSAR